MKESEFLDENAIIIERLKQLPILKAFAKDDIKSLMQFSKVVEYEDGELIIEEGETDSCIFFVLSGRASVVKDGVEIAQLGNVGDVFGEMAVIQGRPRSASVKSVGKTLCLMVDASYIEMLEEGDKGTFMYVIFRIFSMLLATRLSDTNSALIEARQEIERLKANASSL